MGELAVEVLAAAMLAAGLLCGLVAALIVGRTGGDRLVAFGWGAVLGPVGILIATAARVRAPRDASVEEPW